MPTIEEILDVIAPSIPDDATRAIFVSLAKNEVSERTFGDLYNQAVAYLTAHNIILSQGASTTSLGSGSIKRKKAGQEEIEYHAPSAGAAAVGLSLTPFGQKYIDLKRIVSGLRHSNADALRTLES